MTETALDAAGERLRAILESLPCAVAAADYQGRISFLNGEARRLLGASARDAAGKSLRKTFPLLDPACRRPVAVPSCRALIQNPTVRHLGRVLLAVGGEGTADLPVEASLAPLRDRQDRIAGCLLVLRDVGEALIRERGILDRQRIEAIRSMAGNMARDFTNWLSLISGHASAILETTPPQTQSHEAAVRILDATHKAGGLMKHLWTVAKAGKPGEDGGLEAIPIEPLLQESANLARATVLGDRVQLKVTCRPGLPRAWANGVQLLTCLMNLVRNAQEAMPEGGTITLGAEVRTVGRKPFVLIRVRDTGVGMSREVLDRLGTPFFTTRTNGHLGMGLVVVRTLVESWGGFLRVHSRPGRGSLFSLYLPRAPAAASSEVAIRSGILVVDDDAQVLAEVRAALEPARFRVHTATNGADSVELHRRHAGEIGVVLLDALIPGEDVRVTFDRLLANDPDLSVVMMSGFSRDYLRNEIPRGVWGFLQKPFDREQLLAAVHRTFQQRAEQAQRGRSGSA
jgi:two-component system cell cycle sensor histidine kinase/response regulator CckA